MKKCKILLGILALILVACVASNTGWCSSIKTRIENKQAEIEINSKAILQIQHTKEQLHDAANALRQEHTYDENLVLTLSSKWDELNTQEQSLNNEILQLTQEIEELKGEYLGEFELTAYCITGTTATGTHTTADRTIAVDPKIISYGQEVYIEGYGTYIAEDCGGAVKGNIIDIYIPGYQNCVNFGRRAAKVYLIS